MNKVWIKAHGGKLCNLIVGEERAEELIKSSADLKSIDLTRRQIADLEFILNGGFSPLTGFMDEEVYRSVLDDMRLADGTFWPLPITLDVDGGFAGSLGKGEKVVLRDPEGFMLAILTVSDIWRPDKAEEARRIFGPDDAGNPAADLLSKRRKEYYLGGPVEGLRLPIHRDYPELRHSPSSMRAVFSERGWRRIIAYEPHKPFHRADLEFTLKAAGEIDANLLIHPAAVMSKLHDKNHYLKIRAFKAVTRHYPPNMAFLSLLPSLLRLASPREKLLRAIIEKNYGCTHIIVAPEDAKVFKGHEDDLGMEAVIHKKMSYLPAENMFCDDEELPVGAEAACITDDEIIERLEGGGEIPDWFSYPDVIDELLKAYPPRSKQGFTLFFTGFSGSGKSTVANIISAKLLEIGDRDVTLLDGDIVRKNLSSELNFSKEHRDINILRIGFVAKEITKNGGIAICCPIAPYEKVRRENRDKISKNGGYVEIFVNTPIEECEKRDSKGLYAKARAGIIKGMTGIDDPYEVPENAEIVLNTLELTPEEAANEVLLYLEQEGFIK